MQPLKNYMSLMVTYIILNSNGGGGGGGSHWLWSTYIDTSQMILPNILASVLFKKINPI